MDIHINRAHNNSALPTMPETYAFTLIRKTKATSFILIKEKHIITITYSFCMYWMDSEQCGSIKRSTPFF